MSPGTYHRQVDVLNKINDLVYQGNAWAKAFTLDELRSSARPGSLFSSWVREALEESDFERATALIVDSLLGLHMKESSSWAELDDGPWVACSRERAKQVASELQSNKGCAASAEVLSLLLTFQGPVFFLDHEYIKACAVWQDNVCVLFFDAG